MSTFTIDATDFHWIDGSTDYPEDLCLHGHAVAVIGGKKLEYDATVSATALYLLKSLTQDHTVSDCIQMLPCCGHWFIPNKDLSEVTISGCINGIDWLVIHEGDAVRLILEDRTEVTVPLEEYKAEVFRFADKIEAFYRSCTPRVLPEDAFERNGYIAFWNEWRRRRGTERP